MSPLLFSMLATFGTPTATEPPSTGWEDVDYALCIICMLALMMMAHFIRKVAETTDVTDTSKAQKNTTAQPQPLKEQPPAPVEDNVNSAKTQYFGPDHTMRMREEAHPMTEAGTVALRGTLSDGQETQITIKLSDISSKQDFIIGRNEAADLTIKDFTISGVHAILKLIRDEHSSALHISDAKSRNGTYLNGVRLRSGEWHKVRNRDRITMGSCKFTVHSA